MMVIRVVVTVKPEEADSFVAHLTDEAAEVRLLDGCQRFELFQSPEETGRFLLYEEWASATAFDAYRNSPRFRQSFAVLGPMMAGPPDSQYFLATATE